MATILSKSSSAPFIFAFFLAIVTAKPLRSERDLRPLMRSSGEKMSHLHFYWHDTTSGSNPSAVSVASGPQTSKSRTAFGAVFVIDDPMTVGPDPKSKLLGRAQGLYAAASQEEIGLIMAMNFAFVDGKYNGSTVTVLGRNTVLSKVREMPVVGGSGLFRFARGYAQVRTHTFNLTTGDAVVEYHVYVLHY